MSTSSEIVGLYLSTLLERRAQIGWKTVAYDDSYTVHPFLIWDTRANEYHARNLEMDRRRIRYYGRTHRAEAAARQRRWIKNHPLDERQKALAAARQARYCARLKETLK